MGYTARHRDKMSQAIALEFLSLCRALYFLKALFLEY